jgi:hypothetical protein
VVLVVLGVGAGDGGSRSPIARVLEVKGKATIVDPESFDRPAAVFGTVYDDDRLMVEKNSSVVLVFRGDGHIERITAAGDLKVTPEGCQPKAGVQRLTMSEQGRALVGKISKGAKGIVQGGVVVARSAPRKSDNSRRGNVAMLGSPGPICPIPESTLLSTKPTFSWPPIPTAKQYALSLYSKGNKIWSGVSQAARLEYSGEALKPGTVYLWEVTTSVDGAVTTICEGIFRTASDQQRADAADLQKLIEKPDIPYLALAAMWYKQNGLVSEAIAADQQLAKLCNDPTVYWALAGLCGQAGRDDDARAAEEKAVELEKKAEAEGGR